MLLTAITNLCIGVNAISSDFTIEVYNREDYIAAILKSRADWNAPIGLEPMTDIDVSLKDTLSVCDVCGQEYGELLPIFLMDALDSE